MCKLKIYMPRVMSYFFILLFCYAAISKALDFENFQVQIGQSPLLSAYAGTVSYGVIAVEVAAVFLLASDKMRLAGFYLSTALMSAFTIYIYLILNYSEFVPCSCGGILEKMGWTEHLIFNLVCVALGMFATLLLLIQRQKSSIIHCFILISSNILSCAMVCALFLSSEHIIKKENNFTRRFLPFPVMENKVINLSTEDYYFAGSHGDIVYLGNRKSPRIISSIDSACTAVKSFKINPDQMNHSFQHVDLSVLYPYYYLSDGSVPVIYRGKLGNADARTVSYNDAFFSQLSVLDSTNFAIRTINKKNLRLTLGSLNLFSSEKIKLYPDILRKQTDGIFDSDGQLIRTMFPDQFIYLYTYRNQFIIMDSHLNVVNTLKTIDNTHTAQIKTKASVNGVHQMSVPPLTVNKGISAYGHFAFIQSNLRGKYETADSWKNSNVIDAYRTDRQEYIGSFHIDKRNGKSISDFIITDHYFYVLVGNQIVRYILRKPFVNQ